MMVRVLAAVGAGLLVLGGCASTPRDSELVVAPGGYAGMFGAVKDALREHHFTLDVVDARAGLITTLPRSASGYATPWIDHASDAEGALRDTLQNERRRAEVRFEAARGEAQDLRRHEGPMVVRVRVVRERVMRPGRRVDPVSVRTLHYARDTVRDASEREALVYAAGEDDRLAARIASSIDSGREHAVDNR